MSSYRFWCAVLALVFIFIAGVVILLDKILDYPKAERARKLFIAGIIWFLCGGFGAYCVCSYIDERYVCHMPEERIYPSEVVATVQRKEIDNKVIPFYSQEVTNYNVVILYDEKEYQVPVMKEQFDIVVVGKPYTFLAYKDSRGEFYEFLLAEDEF